MVVVDAVVAGPVAALVTIEKKKAEEEEEEDQNVLRISLAFSSQQVMDPLAEQRRTVSKDFSNLLHRKY